MSRETISKVLVRELGFKDALRVMTLAQLWAIFVAAEGRAPTPSEYGETFPWDRATVFRYRQRWAHALPNGPTWEDFTARLARDLQQGRTVSVRAIGARLV